MIGIVKKQNNACRLVNVYQKYYNLLYGYISNSHLRTYAFIKKTVYRLYSNIINLNANYVC